MDYGHPTGTTYISQSKPDIIKILTANLRFLTTASQIATITFKVRKPHLPQYLDQLIEDYATTRQLRSSCKNLLAVPYVKTDTAARAFRVSVPTIWNSLPTLVKSSSTLVTFKRHLKTFLYRRAFD